MIQKYKCKPLLAAAVQWTGENREEIEEFTSNFTCGSVYLTFGKLEIWQYGKKFIVIRGEYIVKNNRNEIQIYDPDVFNVVYEEVE